MQQLLPRHTAAATSLIIALLCGNAFAGSGNSVLVEQISTVQVGENTLFVDQSGATNSFVGGVSQDREIDLDLSGLTSSETDNLLNVIGQASFVSISDNTLVLQSDGPRLTQYGVGNEASITMQGDGGEAALEQFGDYNSATILVNDASRGVLIQDGNRNSGTLNVSDFGASGELVQIGDDNQTELFVTGAGDASVSYTVQGSGVSTTIPASVVSNVNGQITIVQSQFTSLQTR